MDMENTQTETGGPAISMQHPTQPPKDEGSSRRVAIIAVIALLIIVAAIIAAIIWLLQPATPTERIRDIFIIVLAFVSLFVTIALSILIVQVARLINLLQNEIKPILDSTNETVSTLRGTTAFLSDNLVEPVMKINEMAAAMNQVMKFVGLVRRPSRNRSPRGE
jgi:hypothetical protein